MTTPSALDPRTFMEPELTGIDLLMAEKFVEEYLKDFSPVQACIRMGFNETFAGEYAKVYLGKPYVQRKVMEYKLQPRQAETDRVKALIAANLEELSMNGSAQTRVAALGKLMALHGLDQTPDKTGEALEKLVDSFKDIAKSLPD